MSEPRRARVRALAKINLDLRVLAKRPDGYHELRTVFHTVSLADILDVAFTPAPATAIKVAANVEIADNLVVKAACLALDAMRITGRVEFGLRKRIPMGAGLGGGSSDAAAVLLALPVLAGGRLEAEELAGLAAQLGSDVPFFLLGGAAVGLGRGTELYPLPDCPPRPGVLVTPGVHVSTAEAYAALGLPSNSGLTTEAQQNKIFSFQSQAWAGSWNVPGNDFEAVVFERHPELRVLKQQLLDAGAKPALMTGSGSTLYGLFDTRAEASRAIESLGKSRVFPITLVSRSRYRRMWRRGLQAHMNNTSIWPPQSRYAR
ncbi:MAG TPA: 4-(cytidine 5'-diphospho)-2-C-methyl-D-erythritol kinase [Bryobacteraceae bacterium]|nr:4-(cytidine 5'-diphospho)-2-C-methyl-D-erythritol kinase [Bryobacteraceae bacterium]